MSCGRCRWSRSWGCRPWPAKQRGKQRGQPSSQAVPRAIHHGYPACTARQTAILISHWAHLYIFIRYSLHSFVYLYKVLISMTYFYLQKQLTHLYIFIRYSFPWYTFLFKNNLAYWSQFFRCKYFRCTPFSTLCAATKHYIENNSMYCIFRDKCKLPKKQLDKVGIEHTSPCSTNDSFLHSAISLTYIFSQKWKSLRPGINKWLVLSHSLIFLNRCLWNFLKSSVFNRTVGGSCCSSAVEHTPVE